MLIEGGEGVRPDDVVGLLGDLVVEAGSANRWSTAVRACVMPGMVISATVVDATLRVADSAVRLTQSVLGRLGEHARLRGQAGPDRPPRCLVVADQSLEDPTVLEVMRAGAQHSSASFHVLVPGTVDDGADRLRDALRRFDAEGLDVTGEVGDADPTPVIASALAEDRYDGVIIATIPPAAAPSSDR